MIELQWWRWELKDAASSLTEALFEICDRMDAKRLNFFFFEDREGERRDKRC